jgi:hypothetical protein
MHLSKSSCLVFLFVKQDTPVYLTAYLVAFDRITFFIITFLSPYYEMFVFWIAIMYYYDHTLHTWLKLSLVILLQFIYTINCIPVDIQYMH